jgi:replicative DNA helicase
MLARLAPGDLVLLGARPGQGKTLLGLELAVEAARIGRPAFFFTLEDDEGAVLDRLQLLGADRKLVEGRIILDTSDDICAETILNRVGDDAGNAVIIIDYLQLLDQRRRKPELDTQIRALRAFAGATGSITVALSQIDRAFEATGRSFPKLADIRLPNPFDLSLFTKACFMRDGEARLQELA